MLKGLRIGEFFSVDELMGIYKAAKAEYKTSLSDTNEKDKMDYMCLLFADYVHAAYMLHQSPEYMEMYNGFKEICEAKGDTAFLRIWEGMCLNIALHNPELEVTDILRECAASLCELMEEQFGDILKD